jgi:hypothetical protein
VTLYLSGMGVLAERFGQLGGPQRWTNYLIVGGRLVGIHVENADETTLTRHPGLRLSVACPRVRAVEPGTPGACAAKLERALHVGRLLADPREKLRDSAKLPASALNRC